MHKHFLLAIALPLILLSWAFPNEKKIHWDKTTHDFGTIKQGEKVTTTFKYYNHTDTIFQIENVMASCGCVISNWSKAPLNPGDSASITVGFDSKGKFRKHEKVITVYSSHGMFDLIIIANIIRM